MPPSHEEDAEDGPLQMHFSCKWFPFPSPFGVLADHPPRKPILDYVAMVSDKS